MSLNVFTFSGNIGKDAVTRDAGTSQVTEFSCAVNSGYGDRRQTHWITVSVWGARGVKLQPNLIKGQLIAVSGEFSTSVWQDKEGKDRTELKVNANEVSFMSKKEGGAPSPARREEPAQPEEMDDKIPF